MNFRSSPATSWAVESPACHHTPSAHSKQVRCRRFPPRRRTHNCLCHCLSVQHKCLFSLAQSSKSVRNLLAWSQFSLAYVQIVFFIKLLENKKHYLLLSNLAMHCLIFSEFPVYTPNWSPIIRKVKVFAWVSVIKYLQLPPFFSSKCQIDDVLYMCNSTKKEARRLTP